MEERPSSIAILRRSSARSQVSPCLRVVRTRIFSRHCVSGRSSCFLVRISRVSRVSARVPIPRPPTNLRHLQRYGARPLPWPPTRRSPVPVRPPHVRTAISVSSKAAGTGTAPNGNGFPSISRRRLRLSIGGANERGASSRIAHWPIIAPTSEQPGIRQQNVATGRGGKVLVR